MEVLEIGNLDLTQIKQKVMQKQGWSREHADKVEAEYRAFLAIGEKGGNRPTADVDEMWHTHILDTRKYAADCRRIFGGFLHHVPSYKADECTNCDDAPLRRAECTNCDDGPVMKMAACDSDSCSDGCDKSLERATCDMKIANA